VGTVSRLCDTLGLELIVVPRGQIETTELQLERLREKLRRMDLRARHAALASRLLMASQGEAASLVRQARECVNRWERDKLCSKHYIARWRVMLSGRVPRIAKSLLRRNEWTDALLQNSPWMFALERA
jgi:hypothetical protein